MHITDPIADMLTRVLKANSVPPSTIPSMYPLPNEEVHRGDPPGGGLYQDYQVIDDGTQGIIRIALKYNPGKEKVITGLRRVSKPGLRVYVGAEELPRCSRLGIAIVSTSKGVMTDRKPARPMSAAKSLRSCGRGG
jgi:small subunit ribosomal protein S8